MISGGLAAPKGKRILSDLFDLVFVPVVIGVVAGFLLLNASDVVRGTVMITLNIGWLIIRDLFFAPGRMITGVKLVSLVGGNVTPAQAVIRNVLLMVPIVLVIGYVAELISVLSRGKRISDDWAKTQVVEA